jgi:hypothetical protein
MSFIMELRSPDQKRLQTGVLECWSIGVMRPTGIADGHTVEDAEAAGLSPRLRSWVDRSKQEKT